MSKAFGTVLSSVRRSLGISQVQLAAKAGLNYRHLQNIEGGRVDFKVSTAKDLAKALSVPACFLLQENVNPGLSSQEIFCPFSLIEELHVGILIMDVEGTIQYGNKYYMDLLAPFPATEILGKKKIWEFQVKEEDSKLVKEFHDKRVREKITPIPFYSISNGKNGETIPVKVDWNYRYDKQQKLIGFISVLTKAETPLSETGPSVPRQF